MFVLYQTWEDKGIALWLNTNELIWVVYTAKNLYVSVTCLYIDIWTRPGCIGFFDIGSSTC